MNKKKQIIIAIAAALIIVIFFNVIYEKKFKTQYISVYMLNKDVMEKEKIRMEDLVKVNIEKNDNSYIDDFNIKNYIDKKIYKSNLSKGQILLKDTLKEETKEELESEKIKITIPIKDSSYANSYKLRRGDKVNLYYSARLNQVNNILKDFEKNISSSSIDSFVTSLILKDKTIKAIYDENGQEVTNYTKFKEIVFEVDEKLANIITNLKIQGEFDICLSK